ANFQNSFKETVNNMLQIATFVANDPRIQHAFLQGKLAVESEGGGKGKEQAKIARDNLLAIVAPSWAEMTKQFKARQLHFHLGPGSTSFLRVHKPAKFGDNMDNVRYTIVNANKTLQATSGFETGRVYSGIRGVQPVFALSSATQEKVHVGAVESGISYHDVLHNLAETFDINIAVLLTMEHIKANVWPDFLNKRFKRSPPFGDWVIEEATSAEFKNLLGTSAILHSGFSSDKIKMLSWDHRYFVVSEIPLRDYQGSVDPALDNAGKIVFWKDVTHAYIAFFNNFKDNLIYAITAYVLVELLLFFGLRRSTKIFDRIIDQRTQELKQSEGRYRNIFENSLTEIFIFDADTLKFIYVNRGACANIGYTFDELSELTPLDIKPKFTLEQFNELIEPLYTGAEEIIHFTAVHQRKNASLYAVEIHLQLTEFSSKSAFVAIILDITERQKAEERLQLSAKVFSETNEGIIITGTAGTIIDVNPAFSDITGYSRNEVIGKNPRMLSSGKHSPEFYATMWQTINEQGHWQGEVWNRKKDGTLYAELLSISPISDEEGKALHYVGIFSDITHSKKQQETLELIAHYDVLTQLPNRVLLADRFIQALAHNKRQETLLAVCFLDLDNFKPVNDTYGHETGDQLLIEVAERIEENIRGEDTVSRHGGDEFVLLLGDVESPDHCEQVLERIIESLAKPYLIDGQVLSISASIGVSIYPMDEADLDTLMRHADQAMYQAKLAGRNRYSFFNAEQDELDAKRNIKLREIEKALENNDLCLYYQPKVNMETGEVFGVEALIRWIHPEKGIIMPVDFLPIIEATELEIQMGNWIINAALKQLEMWQQQNIKLEVSVNISSYHLQSTSFLDELEKILSLYPCVNSKSLQLEILESSALSDLKLISSIIKTCINSFGISIALDDFGTGYSSLTHLRNLSAKTIKIDQSFVRDILDDPNDYAI
ncbi:MAG: diguanylate cyclase, partial [Methyloprofundus sp.]|nr:diguanylate cyclase [Methyloprofundus sp.]